MFPLASLFFQHINALVCLSDTAAHYNRDVDLEWWQLYCRREYWNGAVTKCHFRTSWVQIDIEWLYHTRRAAYFWQFDVLITSGSPATVVVCCSALCKNVIDGFLFKSRIASRGKMLLLLKVTQGHLNLHRLERVYVPISVSL